MADNQEVPEELPVEEITWIFSSEVLEHKTPSREDGISSATERRYRREGARFIINASNTLKLRRDTLATGAVFFHRFFMVQSFKDFDRWVVASTCMLLAGKVEETPKQCRNIIKVVQQMLTPEQMKAFGNDPKEELLSHERVLIQTIRFDLQVYHPYDHLLKFAQSLKGEKEKIESVLQMAWTFINDSLCTTLCLQWEPPAIAVAMLYLSGKLSKFDLQAATQASSKRSWWRQFVGTVDTHDLESICHQVLDVYSEEEKSAKREEATTTITTVSQQPPSSSVSHSPLLSSSGTVGQASPLSLPGVPSHDSNTTRGYHGNPSPAHPLMGSQSGNVQLQTPPTVHPQLGIPPRAATPHGPLPQQVLVTNYLNQVQQSSNNYPPSIGGVAHYQTMQLPPTAGNTAGGISHIRMATPIGSHYPPGMNPESASSNYQGYPLVGGGVMPTRGGTIPSSTLPPASVHRLPQHSNIANWKK